MLQMYGRKIMCNGGLMVCLNYLMLDNDADAW